MVSIGYAKNEPFELIVGNILIGIGGFLLGWAFLDNSLFHLTIPSFIIFGFGVIFDVRVLRKFGKTLTELKRNISKAEINLKQTEKNLQQTTKATEKANAELSTTTKELQKTKFEIRKIEQNIKKTEEKIFGSGGSSFSRTSWANPIERNLEDLKKRISSLENSLKDLKRNSSFKRF